MGSKWKKFDKCPYCQGLRIRKDNGEWFCLDCGARWE